MSLSLSLDASLLSTAGGTLPLDDVRLVELARQGREDAFDLLVHRHAQDVHVLCRRMTGDAAAAEDLVQEAFLNAWRALESFDGRAGFRTWLTRIAVNACLSWRRARARSRHHQEQALAGRADVVDAEAPGSDLAARLEVLITALPPRQRIVLSLRVFQGRSFGEIAEAIGSSEAACRVLLCEARRKLREQLGR